MKLTKNNITNSIIIIIIFACTGVTSVYVSSFIVNSFGMEKWSLHYILVYIFLIVPVYHLLLLGYALLFGKFNYFWGRAKTVVNRIAEWFS